VAKSDFRSVDEYIASQPEASELTLVNIAEDSLKIEGAED
jgi:hypothetical protein